MTSVPDFARKLQEYRDASTCCALLVDPFLREFRRVELPLRLEDPDVNCTCCKYVSLRAVKQVLGLSKAQSVCTVRLKCGGEGNDVQLYLEEFDYVSPHIKGFTIGGAAGNSVTYKGRGLLVSNPMLREEGSSRYLSGNTSMDDSQMQLLTSAISFCSSGAASRAQAAEADERLAHAGPSTVVLTGITDPRPRCAYCNTQEEGGARLLQCSACKAVKYCNTQCQKAHWKVHKPVCVRK